MLPDLIAERYLSRIHFDQSESFAGFFGDTFQSGRKHHPSTSQQGHLRERIELVVRPHPGQLVPRAFLTDTEGLGRFVDEEVATLQQRCDPGAHHKSGR